MEKRKKINKEKGRVHLEKKKNKKEKDEKRKKTGESLLHAVAAST